jgi:hypothetical protein
MIGRGICAFLATAAIGAVTPTPGGTPGVGEGRPVVIEFSPGGSVVEFRLKGLAFAWRKVQVVVDGPCLSACTLLVDLDRANVCLTTQAILGYHQSFWDDPSGRHYSPLTYETPGLNAYLMSRGGEPKDDLMLMPFDQAQQFYHPCKGAAVEAAWHGRRLT